MWPLALMSTVASQHRPCRPLAATTLAPALLRPHAPLALPAQIVVDDALTPAQVDDLNALYDAAIAGEAPPEFDGPNVKSLRGSSAGKNMPLSSVIADRDGREYEGRRFWGQPYVDLIDLPTVLPILEELLGQPSWEHAPRRRAR